MKTKLFCILALTLFICGTCFSQKKYSKSQFTLFVYVVNIDDRVKKEIQPFEGYIDLKTEGDQTKTEGMLVHTLYDVTKTIFSDTLSCFLLPANSLGNKAKYDLYGYPEVSIQKAIRLSNTKYFLKILAYIENNNYDAHGKKLTEDVFRPQVRLTLELYNKFGFVPIQTSSAIASATQNVKVTTEYLNGMNFLQPKERTTTEQTLRDLFVSAANQAVLDLKYKTSK